MKIAIPIENEEVFQHFGHTSVFRIFDVMDDGSRTTEDVSVQVEGHDAVAAWLQEQKVQLVICGGIGDGAVSALRENGILLCSGASGNAEQCLEAFLRYAEQYESGATCPGHSEGGCSGGCGGCSGGCGGCGGCHETPAASDYVETRTFSDIVTLTKDNFQTEVIEDPGLILIDFWAEWCGPCKMMAPIFEELNLEETKVKFCRVNVDEEEELSRVFGIQSIPTFIVVQNCRTLNGVIGACEKEQLSAMLAQFQN